MAPHEGEFGSGRTFALTQFGIAALDRGVPSGVMEGIMKEMFEDGPITSTDIISEYTSVEPLMLKRIVDEAISKGWVEVIE